MALTPASVYERVMPAMNMKVARAFHQLANFILSDLPIRAPIPSTV